jgi:hypothetical protein
MRFVAPFPYTETHNLMNNPDERYHRLYVIAFTCPILWITHCGTKIIFLWLKISRRTRIIFGVTLDDLISIFALITVALTTIGVTATFKLIAAYYNSENAIFVVENILFIALCFSMFWKVWDSPSFGGCLYC